MKQSLHFKARNQSDAHDWDDYKIAKPARRSKIKTTSFYLTMRDGVKIAVDLHLPKNLPAGTKLPTIFRATRYVRSIELRWPISIFLWPKKELVQRFLGNGYAWVDVDARGSGASFGVRKVELSPDEIKDYGEIIDWITSQSWSDGNVGATGISYEGTTSELLLSLGHPAVKAIATRFSLFDIQSDIALINGIPLPSFSKEWQAGNSALDRNKMHEVIDDWEKRLAVIGTKPVDNDEDHKLLDVAVAEHADNFNTHEGIEKFITGTEPFPETWPAKITSLTDLSPAAFVDQYADSGAAIYSVSGWFDGAYGRSAIRRFMNVNNPDHRLLLGPWTHGGRFDASPAQRPTSFDHDMELLRFFDHHLKDVSTGIESEPRVRYFTMIENKWKSADDWPPPASPINFYLAADGVLSLSKPDNSDDPDQYEVDYEVGTGIHSRWDTTLDGEQVTYPDRTAQNKNLLTYTTEPLQNDTEVTGHPIITLHIKTSAENGNFFVYLEDVHPDGYVAYVTEGVLQGRHANPDEDVQRYKTVAGPYRSFRRELAKPMRPDEITTLVFDLLPTSYLFRPNHRIRIAFSGADKDHFIPPERSPETTIEYFRNASYPSHITLPIVKRSD